MKIIQYEVLGYTDIWNAETEETEQKECVSSAKVTCKNQTEFDAVYPTVEEAAIPGSINVTGKFDSEPTTEEVLNALLGVTA